MNILRTGEPTRIPHGKVCGLSLAFRGRRPSAMLRSFTLIDVDIVDRLIDDLPDII